MDQDPRPESFAPPEPAELDALLEGYEVSSLIACGGMGAVYRARQKSLDRDVAIKILPRELGEDAEFRSRFRAEAKAMARLRHPNLIAVHDFGQAGPYLFIVMDFVNGKSLFHSANGIAIEDKAAARLIHAICEGVAHAHEEGIVHHDLKPANILLDPQKQPRIGDFGLARPADDADSDGLHFGTPDYTAPEVMKDPASATKRSDVFSIGVMLYELLTGELPGKSYAPPSRHAEVEVDARFDPIVRRALHPAPGLRYADANELLRELDRLDKALNKPAPRKGDADAKRAELQTDADIEGVDESAPRMKSADHSKVVARNVVIIVILLMAILFTLAAYNRRRNEITRKNKRTAEEEENQKGAPREPSFHIRPDAPRPKPVSPDGPKPRVEPLPGQPLDLARLKTGLASGKRDRFPPETRDFGEGKIFPVGTPMIWPKASAFAEAHGGHLLTLADDEEKRALAELLPGSTAVWLGGGTTGRSTMGWMDGTTWALSNKPPSGTGGYLSMTSNGLLRASRGLEKLPFFIQWHMDGRNPGSRAEQWERLRSSKGQPEPVYPPGVFSDGARRYLIQFASSNWEEAASLASNAGGHLAVTSEETEWKFLQSEIVPALPAKTVVWMGGRFGGKRWSWTTGENWTFAPWVERPHHADDPERTALCLVPAAESAGYAWDNADPAEDSAATAFIIEWSEDQKARTAPGPVPQAEWMAFRTRAANRLEKDYRNHLGEIRKNGETLDRDLQNWLASLDPRIRGRYANTIIRARGTIMADGRIDETNLSKLPPLPADIGATCNGSLLHQRRLDSDFKLALDKLRIAYLEELQTRRVEAHKRRLLHEIVEIGEEMETCGANGPEFLRHFGLGPKEEAPEE